MLALCYLIDFHVTHSFGFRFRFEVFLSEILLPIFFMANKPQLTFARIVSGTIDTNCTGNGNNAITQDSVTTAVASTTTATAITIATTTNDTDTAASAIADTITDTAITETVSSEITDVSIAEIESGSHISGTSSGDSCDVTLSSVPNNKNKQSLHQRFIEERKSDSDGNAHIQRPIQFGQHQQNQHHQQIQRRSKPRSKTDRLRKVVLKNIISLLFLCISL